MRMSLPAPWKAIGPCVPATTTLPDASTATLAPAVYAPAGITTHAWLMVAPVSTYLTRSRLLVVPASFLSPYPAAYTAPSGPVATDVKPALSAVERSPDQTRGSDAAPAAGAPQRMRSTAKAARPPTSREWCIVLPPFGPGSPAWSRGGRWGGRLFGLPPRRRVRLLLAAPEAVIHRR